MKKLFLLIFLLLATPLLAQYQSDVILTSPDAAWTDARAYATLNSAIAAAGADERTILIPSPQTVAALVVPSNVTLEFTRDGSISNAGQLTIQTTKIVAPNRQIFTGAGNIDFANGTVIKSGWFSNFESAIALTFNDQVTLEVTKPQTLTASYSVGNNVAMKWSAPGNVITVDTGLTLGNMHQPEAGDYQILAGSGTVDFDDGILLDTVWFDSLRTLNTWAATSTLTYRVSGTTLVDFNTTIPSSVVVDIDSKSGYFNVSAGVTLTIEGVISSLSPHRIFSTTGTVVFTNSPSIIYPQWWGAIGDGVTDSTAAFNAAIASCKSSSNTIYVLSGIYNVTNTLDLTGTGQIRMIGYGPWNTKIVTTVTNTPGITLGGHITTRKSGVEGIYLYKAGALPIAQVAGNYGIQVPDVGAGDGVYMRDLYISGFSNSAIRIAGPTGPTIVEDAWIAYCAGYGIEIVDGPQDVTINRGSIQAQWGGILVDTTSTGMAVYDTDIELGTSATLPAIYVGATSGGHSFHNVTTSIGAVPTPAGVIVIAGFGNTIVGGINVTLTVPVDNILFSGGSAQNNTVIGGYYVNSQVSAGSSGYFAQIPLGINNTIINPFLTTASYDTGFNIVNDVTANFTTVVGIANVGHAGSIANGVGFPNTVVEDLSVRGTTSLGGNITVTKAGDTITEYNDSSAGVNEKVWRVNVGQGLMDTLILNDAKDTAQYIWRITRSGMTVTTVELIQGVLTLNQTPRLNGPTQATIGAAGGAAALPATPLGYVEINIAGTPVLIPYYPKP